MFRFGTHFELVRKSRPNFWIEGAACLVISKIIQASMATVAAEANQQSARKRSGRFLNSLIPLCSIAAASVCISLRMNLPRLFHRCQSGLTLIDDGGWERNVTELGREFLAVS